jgi:ABC-type methionine transport system permease subunit
LLLTGERAVREKEILFHVVKRIISVSRFVPCKSILVLVILGETELIKGMNFNVNGEKKGMILRAIYIVLGPS